MRSLWPILLTLPLALGGTGDAPASWSKGTPAANTAQLLTPANQAVELPAWLAERVTGPTLVWYFNPHCSHCQHAIPGVVALSKELEGQVAFIGVANSGSSPKELQWFMDTYQVPFTLMIDTPRGFAWSVGARSTPTALLFEPDGQGGVVATDAYYPWFDGAATLMKMRRSAGQGQDAFAHFEPGVYQGNTVCSACHLEESRSWQLSHHSVAYLTIYKAEKTTDPECVSCHVTGLGQPSGFVLGDHASDLMHVGCESCHSAGGPHDGESVVASEQCETCHDAKHSIDFSVEKGLPHIDHYLAATLSEKELQARIQALNDGSAERPLLAFPEGHNLAAQDCVSCHEGAVQAWERGPHAGAMKLLKRKQQQDTQCVSCHATAVEAGAPPKSLEGYQVKDGVSCASCHGPGQPHLDAPGAGSIEGLGEDCPVCVIEAVCTSCHDSEQDPDWDLDTALARQKGHFSGSSPDGGSN
ncbi:MAG: multiheme c-type cytochrome [Myxococcota bacterium]|nr:multiheme c-type cytochrome [Myxococcota bacterium]